MDDPYAMMMVATAGLILVLIANVCLWLLEKK
jgi:hypothetical protein